MKATLETSPDYKQKVKSISYKKSETKVIHMEKQLMEHFGCDYSGLHKLLVRKYYQMI
tara:strand:+ start:60 stop:233 length:174 start_codon:yes stop_codon:yes gene_type:complete